jgi:hypothetical protein
MKISTLAVGLMALIGCLLFSQEAKAQNVWGYSSIYYNNSTHYVTATSTTELDYFVQEYYKVRVNSKITDENGIALVSGYATDNLQAGYISVTLQAWNWQGIENSNKARILDAEITPGEVRDMVGGTLPIVIDSSTNN